MIWLKIVLLFIAISLRSIFGWGESEIDDYYENY